VNQDIPRAASGSEPSRSRIGVVVTILVVIALLHLLRVGTFLRGRLFALHYCHFSDIVVPLG